MKGLVVLVLVVLAVIAVLAYLLRQHRAWVKAQAPKPPQPWRVEVMESELHPITTFILTNGIDRERFTSISRLDDDYEQKLYEARAGADDEAVERNTIQKRLRP